MTDNIANDGRDASGTQRRSDGTRSGATSEGAGSAAGAPDTSPQLARARRATAEAWRRLEEQYGLLTSDEVAERLRLNPQNRNVVSSLRKARKIIGVRRGSSYRYPGFQLDDQSILPVIEPFLELAQTNAWTSDDLSLWMLGPNTYFDKEDRPVDHLGEPEAVLAAAKLAMEARW